MKSNKLVSLVFTAVTALAATVQAADHAPFVRAEVAYTDTGYDASIFQPEGYEAGLAVTTGLLFNAKHEVSVSTGYTKWEGKHSVAVGFVDVNNEIGQIPLLLNYRYRIAVTPELSLALGPTAGLIYEKATGNVFFNGGLPNLKPVGSYTDSDWKTAFGGTLAAEYKLTQSWSLTASAQVLHVSGSDYDITGVSGKTPYEATTRPSFTLGASYRW